MVLFRTSILLPRMILYSLMLMSFFPLLAGPYMYVCSACLFYVDPDWNYVHTDCILVMWPGIFTEKNIIQNISLIYMYVPPYLHRDFTGIRDLKYWSIALSCAFYRGRKNILWIFFSFIVINPRHLCLPFGSVFLS